MTVNLKDRAGSHPDMAVDEEELEEPRLGGTDIFRGGLVIGLALLIGGFVMLRGLTADSTTATDSTTTELDAEVDTSGAATSGAADVGTTIDGSEQSSTTAGIAPADPTVADSTQSSLDDPAMVDNGDGDAMAETGDPDAMAESGLRSPAEVRVLVLNGAAQRQGVAASGTEALKAASYNTAAPKNATKTTAQSLILYLDGYQAEAQAVANTFGPNLTGIVQPYDPTNPPIDDIQGANVIVIIGEDDTIPIS